MAASLEAAPEALSIGTAKAFQKGYDYRDVKIRMGEEFALKCTEGSEYAKAGESLLIVREGSYYVAHDGYVNDEQRVVLRQPVFRTRDAFYTSGVHSSQLDYAAKPSGDSPAPEWRGTMAAETRLP